MDEHPLVVVVTPEGTTLVHREAIPVSHLFGDLHLTWTRIADTLAHPVLLSAVPVLVTVDVQSFVCWTAHEVGAARKVIVGVWTVSPDVDVTVCRVER